MRMWTIMSLFMCAFRHEVLSRYHWGILSNAQNVLFDCILSACMMQKVISWWMNEWMAGHGQKVHFDSFTHAIAWLCGHLTKLQIGLKHQQMKGFIHVNVYKCFHYNIKPYEMRMRRRSSSNAIIYQTKISIAHQSHFIKCTLYMRLHAFVDSFIHFERYRHVNTNDE